VRKSKWGGLVWESQNRYSKKLYSTLANCVTIQRTPLQWIVSRDFPIFEGMKKFHYRHSAKKCIKYSFDSRAHLKTERRLCFPTSDRLETWLLSSDRPGLDNITSQPWSDANCHRRTSDSAYFPFVLVENNKTKYKKRWHGGKLGQTMVDWKFV